MRCKACDSPLLPREIIWDDDRKEHEELCSKCRVEVRNCANVDISYVEDFEELDGFNE